MSVSKQSIAALCEKYSEIKRLRVGVDADEAGPRERMVALSQRFPGALRELDELPLSIVEHRLRVLDAILEGGDEAPEWVQLQIGYHGLMRVALRIKRMAIDAGPDPARQVLAELASSYVPGPDEPALESLDLAAIAAIVKPEGGRLNPWVFRRVAETFGVDARRVERALFLERREGGGREDEFEP